MSLLPTFLHTPSSLCDLVACSMRNQSKPFFIELLKMWDFVHVFKSAVEKINRLSYWNCSDEWVKRNSYKACWWEQWKSRHPAPLANERNEWPETFPIYSYNIVHNTKANAVQFCKQSILDVSFKLAGSEFFCGKEKSSNRVDSSKIHTQHILVNNPTLTTALQISLKRFTWKMI